MVKDLSFIFHMDGEEPGLVELSWHRKFCSFLLCCPSPPF